MEIRYKNWLITGGCGFIGLNLMEDLLRLSRRGNINIRILDNLSVGKKEDIKEVVDDFREVQKEEIKENPKGIELLVGDIRNFEDCLCACKGVDVVVHLAANTGVEPSIRNPRYDLETNVMGTLNILEASIKDNIKKFIFASSNAPLGRAEPPVNEETAPKPLSPYGASKLAGEGYCLAYYHSFGLNTIVLRFGNVYGPYSKRKNSVVAKFIKRALKGLPLEIYGDGSQTRDFIYVKDLTRAIVLASNSDVGGEIFQIATYKETTVQEIAQTIKEIFERELGRDKKNEISLIYKNPRIGDMKRNFADISKAKTVLGFEPKTHIVDGIKETIKYFYNLYLNENS